MSKKIISAILVMAMIVSMSATAIIGSLGAAAATDYEADRATLKALIEKLVKYGPELQDRTMNLLKETKLLTWNDDKKEYQALLDRDGFWSGRAYDQASYIFLGEDDTLGQHFVENNKINMNGKVVWRKTLEEGETYLDLASKNVSAIVEYAASAWYFGQDANNEIVDPSFNEGRNAVVKAAIGLINSVFEALAKEVGSNVKPLGYDSIYWSERYAGIFGETGFFNQSIGYNPYYYIINDDDYWFDAMYWGGNALGQYPVRWYTFAEADQLAKQEAFDFNTALRTLAMKIGDAPKGIIWAPNNTEFGSQRAAQEAALVYNGNGAGVLFWDFLEGDYAKFQAIIDKLVEKLIGKIDMYFGDAADFSAQYKAYLKLEILVDLYDKYIKDVYNNIYSYTSASAALLNDVLYAKRIIEYVREKDSNARLMVLALTDFNTLIAKIEAGIKAAAPKNDYQKLDAANIGEGTELVRKAEALLKNWDWSGKKDDDPYKIAWVRLNAAKEDLKTMLPAAAGESVLIIVPAGTRNMKHVIGDPGEKITNDRVTVEFTPNYYSYWKFRAILIAALDAFNDRLTAATLPDVATTLPVDAESVVNEINKYAFLAGIVGPILKYNKDTKTIEDIPYVDANNNPTNAHRASKTYSFYLFDYVKSADITYPNTHAMALLASNVTDGSGENRDGIGDELKAVTSIYEQVVGYARGNNTHENNSNDKFTEELMNYDWLNVDWATANGLELNFKEEASLFLNQDVAIDSVYNFLETLFTVARDARDHFDPKASTLVGFDWTIPDAVELTDATSTGYIGRIRSALKLLTADITKLVQIYGWVFYNVAQVLGWDYDVNGDGRTVLLTKIEDGPLAAILPCITDANVSSEKSYGSKDGEESNYPEGFFKKAKSAGLALERLLAQNINETPATKSSIIKAYDNFVKALKAYILTEAGAAKFDEFVDDVYYIVDHFFGEGDSYNYNELYQKLASGTNTIFANKLIDAKNCYQYFQMKFEHAVEDKHKTNAMFNLYYGKTDAFGEGGSKEAPLYRNYIKPLEALIKENNVSGYTRDFADKYQEIRRIAALIRGCIYGDSENGYTVEFNDLRDMPVWFAEKVLNELTSTWADRANYTIDGLRAYKADLEALLREADGKNVYAYKTNTDESKAIWDAFVEAYRNAQYVALDTRCPKADVDNAVAALKAAMANLAKIEAVDGAADKDTLAAKIAEAEALFARANVTEDKAAKDNLVVAISEAKKALQFTITVLNSNDLETVIKNLDNAINALTKSMYTGKDLRKDTKVLELQVVVDLYTEGSYRKFANAVEAAYAMAEADTATESAMKNAYKAVADRFADLKLAPVEEPVQEPEVVIVEVEKPSVVLEQAKAIYKEANDGYAKAVEGCTADTAAAYKAAIDTLKADIDKEADDAKLLASIITLNLAKAALTVDVPETIDD